MRKSAVFLLAFLFPVFASAHVTVKPNEVGVGAWQTFNVSVPVEKDVATVGIRLVVPGELEYVTPNVKPGWTVETVKMGEVEEAMIHEIKWTGGSIPAGMRDDFFFSAHVPATEGTLQWKAYQTYADGSVVSWDVSEADQPKDAQGEDDFSTKGPYSETKVINDLKKEEVKKDEKPMREGASMDKDVRGGHRQGGGANLWTILALLMSGGALYLGIRNTCASYTKENTDG